MDNRLRTLTQWVRQFPGFEKADPQPVSGDASFRRYFRVLGDGQPFIVMDAPPEHEDCTPFVAIADTGRHRASPFRGYWVKIWNRDCFCWKTLATP